MMNFKHILCILLLSYFFLDFSFARTEGGQVDDLAENEYINDKEKTPEEVQNPTVAKKAYNSLKNLWNKNPKQQQVEKNMEEDTIQDEQPKTFDGNSDKFEDAESQVLLDNTYNEDGNTEKEGDSHPIMANDEVHVDEGQERQNDERDKEDKIQEEQPKTFDDKSDKFEDAESQVLLDNTYNEDGNTEKEGDSHPIMANDEVHVEGQERQNDEEVHIPAADEIKKEKQGVHEPSLLPEGDAYSENIKDTKDEHGQFDNNHEKGVEDNEDGSTVAEVTHTSSDLEVGGHKTALLPEGGRDEIRADELEDESDKAEDEVPLVATEDIVEIDETTYDNDEITLSEEDRKERMFCVISGSADPPMKFSRDFPSDICHTIVYGKSIVIDQKHIIRKLNEKEAATLKHYAENKGELLFIVIITHSSYSNWSRALSEKGLAKEVEVVVQFAKKYQVDGVQFADLYQQVGEPVDTEMECKLIKFFRMLAKKMEDLGIGLEINAFEPTVATSFPYGNINKHVDWYVLNTIDMVKCSPAYLTGTNPLMGTYSIENSVTQLLLSSIEKEKIVIGLQMFVTEPDGKRHSYGRKCKKPDDKTKEWCAESSETLYLKGYAMRFLDILGVQLYYVDTDDFMGWCDCDYYPGFRALHAGLWNLPLESVSCTKLGHTEANPEAVCDSTTAAGESVDHDD